MTGRGVDNIFIATLHVERFLMPIHDDRDVCVIRRLGCCWFGLAALARNAKPLGMYAVGIQTNLDESLSNNIDHRVGPADESGRIKSCAKSFMQLTHFVCIEAPCRNRKLLIFLTEHKVQLQSLRMQVL